MSKQSTPPNIFLFFSIAIYIWGCSEEKKESSFEWETCPLFYDSEDGGDAECAYVTVPVDWSKPDGETLDIFVQRHPAAPEERTQALWMLQGGPGASGAGFAATMASMSNTNSNLVVYTLDHRGVGRSARLGCSKYEAEESSSGVSIDATELDACLADVRSEWGDGFHQFTATAAARDLAKVIETTTDANIENFIYGFSYGTWWAHRYLQLFPKDSHGVILDGIVSPNQSLWDADRGWDWAGRELMAVCEADQLCSSHLGDDPWDRLTGLFNDLDNGHCPEVGQNEFYSRGFLRRILAKLVRSSDKRVLLPAMIHRLARCTPEDVAAFTNLVVTLFAEVYSDELYSFILGQHIWLSELYGFPEQTTEQLEAMMDDFHVSQENMGVMAQLKADWPTYPVDEHYRKWAKTDVPMLMLNGTLDPQTPMYMATPMAEHFDGPHQNFFEVPYAAHGTIWYSKGLPPGVPCAMNLMLQFIDDPKGTLNTDCLDAIEPPDFQGTKELAEHYLATYDLWED